MDSFSARRRFSTLSLAAFIAGCSSNTVAPGDAGVATAPDATVAGSTPLPCDVNAVVVERCQICHSDPPQSGAPMPLVTWEDFQAKTPPDALGPSPVTGTYVYQTAQYRIGDDQAPMPPAPNARLDATDMVTLNAWFSAGAPKTDSAVCADDASVAVPDAAPPTVACSTNNVTVAPASAWTMPASVQNEYVCYTATVPVFGDGGINHVMAVTPNIVNHKIVHHVLLYQADPADSTVTLTPAPCNPGGSLTWRIVYGWAPGGGAMQTPPNVGFPYDSSTQWIVQVHYNNVNALTGETDTSGFSFCSTDEPVQYDADTVAFGTQNIKIPPLSVLDETATYTIPALLDGTHLFAAFPHMHELGMAIETEQIVSGAGIVDLGRNDPWNFNQQIWFPIQGTLHTGDVVKTRCAWQNNTTSEVDFGPYTNNEMCYSFTAYYPRVTTSAFSWALPALSATVAPTPDAGLPVPDGGWAIDDAGVGADD